MVGGNEIERRVHRRDKVAEITILLLSYYSAMIWTTDLNLVSHGRLSTDRIHRPIRPEMRKLGLQSGDGAVDYTDHREQDPFYQVF